MRCATLAVSAATTIALASSAMAGVVYNDSATDVNADMLGNPLMNILSVEVSHTSTNIEFLFTLNDFVSPYSSNYYAIALSTPGAATKTTSVWNPVNRASFASNGGMNYVVAADIDSGGRTWFQSHGASGWSTPGQNQNSSFQSSYETNTMVINVTRSAIGMEGDGTFFFDAWAMARNNSVFDALSTNATLGSYDSSFTTTSALSYTIGAPVPAPGAFALLGAAGLLGSRRRRA